MVDATIQEQVDGLIGRIRTVKTMPELDALRPEIGKIITTGDKVNFVKLQGALIKAKNRLKRIPIRDRTW